VSVQTVKNVPLEYERALRIATETYYWKPMAALARAVELQTYAEAGLHLAHPVLDLGCGDGRAALMLKRVGVIDTPPCGLEISLHALQQAQGISAHTTLVCADANRLPFANASFASVVSNADVLSAILGGPDHALGEIHRVLDAGGLFVATVSTSRFMDVLLWPTVLEWLSPGLRDRYVRRLDQRLPRVIALPRDEWQRRFTRHGLQVIRCEEFFSRRTGRLWSILALQICRTFAILRSLDSPAVTKAMSSLWRRLFAPILQADRKAEAPFGYLLLVARKTS
jgi:SAM-dependent methyltransferase